MTKKLARSNDDRMIAGVLGGFAERYGWDSTLLRLLFVASILLPGPQAFLYVVAWIVMPKKTYF